jgi:hypothetical protein
MSYPSYRVIQHRVAFVAIANVFQNRAGLLKKSLDKLYCLAQAQIFLPISKSCKAPIFVNFTGETLLSAEKYRSE